MTAPTLAYPLLEPPGACLACGTVGLRPLHVYNVGTPAAVPALQLALVGCGRCGLVVSHPLPSAEALDAYYERPGGWDDRISYEGAALERKLEAKRVRHGLELEHLVRRFPELEHVEGGKALDYGCGIGAWLDVLAAAGWSTTGLEPGPTARAITAGRHEVIDVVPDDPSFSFVVVYHVLEHLRDPAEVLRKLARATSIGGLIVVSVPDFGGLALHKKFRYTASARHIASFTAPSLRGVLALTGFDMIETSAEASVTWPLDEPHRLRCVARRTDQPLALPPDPLLAAEASLRAYGTYEIEERERLRAANAQAPRRPRARAAAAVRALLQTGRR